VLLLAAGADVELLLAECRRRGIGVVPCEQGGELVLTVTVTPAAAALEALPGVRAVLAPSSPHPLVDRAGPVEVGTLRIGGNAAPLLIAGPCAIESAEQIGAAAALAAEAGARLLRGGAYKPRSSPYAFQGRGLEALRWLREAADRHGLAVVTEALDDESLAAVTEFADVIQVGSRTMHAYGLLKAIGRRGLPVLLKRGMAATIEEWLLAAEYLLDAGADGVMLCERGIRTFEPLTRNTLDLTAVAYLKEHHSLPVIVDPSHGGGRRELVPRLARAALAAGADGLMIEFHPDPALARSDAEQAMAPAAFLSLARELVAQPMGVER
jgi:3-deoxy-7-phosphoheptulonate synthase